MYYSYTYSNKGAMFKKYSNVVYNCRKGGGVLGVDRA